MKIILVPNRVDLLGRNYCLASTLAKQGHEVHYFMWALPYNIKASDLLKHFATSLIAKSYQYENVTVHTVRRLPYFWPYINGWLFKAQLRKLYQKLDADVVISQSYTNETEVPRDLPFIYDLADDYSAPADVYGSPAYKLAFKLLGVRNVMKRQCQNALAVTAVSEVLIKFASQYNDNVTKLPNGVEDGLIRAILSDDSTRAKNKHSLVYASGFGQWSRVTETMQAVTRLRKKFPKIELTLVGSGTESEKIKQYIKDKHADDYIHYLGLVRDRKKLFGIINKSTIGLNVSDKNKWRDASYPMKVMDYSALGKKIVSTDLTEVKALNYPNILLLSDKGRNGSLATTIEQALEDKKNYKFISKRVLRDYSWDAITGKLVGLINENLA